MDKLWVEFTTLLVNHPILIVGLVVIAIACFGLGYLLSHRIDKGDALRERIATVERLLEHAQQEQTRITQEIERLEPEIARHVSTIERLRAVSLPGPQRGQITLLAEGTSQMVITVTGISTANAEVGEALSRIAMEVRNLTIGSPETGRPTLTRSRKPRPDHG
jgi:hypothetical protein